MRFIVVDHPADAVLHSRLRKIEKQPYGLTKEAKIAQQLLGMGPVQLFDRLDFQHQTIINQNVDPESCVEPLTVEFDWYANLSVDLQTPNLQPSCKDGFVHIFEQTRSKLAMDTNTFIHDNGA